MKTVVLGFDALDFRYLDRFSASLPHITALRDRGVEAPLESTHPPWTGSAWPSLYTGTDPSYHGVYGFFDHHGYPNDASLVSRSSVDQPAVWDYLSNEGIPSIVTNVPITHPADPIEGVLIPGYLASENEPGHPEGIRDELGDELGEEYTIYSRHEISSDPDEKFEGYMNLIDQRRRATRSLLENREWELAFCQVQKTDAVFHNFDDEDRFRAIYEQADRLVGDVLETVDEETNVVLCSDHGIGPITGHTIYVNEILREHGYVVASDDDGNAQPTLNTEKSSLLNEETSTDRTMLEQVLLECQRVAERFGVEPNDVYSVAERLGLGGTLARYTPSSLLSAASQTVEWRSSKAYCSSGTRMGVRVNLAGREPNGQVQPSEYEAVREDIIEILSALETPDGEPAFEFVCRREELYDGPHLEGVPDVLFLPTEMNHTVSPTLYGRRFGPSKTYDHKRDGAFIGAGPEFQGTAPGKLSITDVAPITMSLLGQPVPSTMTGTVPEGMVRGPIARADYEETVYGTTTEPSIDDSDVTDRLEDLGYL